MGLTIRELAHDDAAAWRLGATTFGGDRDVPPPPERRVDVASTWWGAYDDTGRLVGKAVDIHQEQWWSGRRMPACGVAGVAVEPEQRGRGVTRAMMRTLLHAARDRGAAVAALFCTTSRVYRSYGFEACGDLRWVDVPTAALPALAADGVRLRPGDGSDWPAVRAVYDEVASGHNGLLDRRGGRFADPPAGELPRGIDGLTLAEDDSGAVVGYLTWERGHGYGQDAVVTVPDCFALTPAAGAALVSSLRGWDSVAPTLRLRRTDSVDAVGVLLPLERARLHSSAMWMHRPVDAAAAIAARAWPTSLRGSVELHLQDDVLEANAGAWRLTVEDGKGCLERSDGDPSIRLTLRGWSLLYCGAATPGELRHAGLVSGGDDDELGLLAAILGCGGPAVLLDYF